MSQRMDSDDLDNLIAQYDEVVRILIFCKCPLTRQEDREKWLLSQLELNPRNQTPNAELLDRYEDLEKRILSQLELVPQIQAYYTVLFGILSNCLFRHKFKEAACRVIVKPNRMVPYGALAILCKIVLDDLFSDDLIEEVFQLMLLEGIKRSALLSRDDEPEVFQLILMWLRRRPLELDQALVIASMILSNGSFESDFKQEVYRLIYDGIEYMLREPFLEIAARISSNASIRDSIRPELIEALRRRQIYFESQLSPSEERVERLAERT